VPDIPGFDDWVETLDIDLGEGSGEEDSRRRRAVLMRWLKSLYDSQGPLSKDLVEIAFVLDQISRAQDNSAVVLRDIERSGRRCPTIEVDDYCNAVRISIDGSYTTPSVWEWENPEALVETAAYIQEQLMDEDVWPECPIHGQYLRPEARGGTAVWWCVTGDHPVAPVGELGTASTQ